MINKSKVRNMDCAELLNCCGKFLKCNSLGVKSIDWPSKEQVKDATILMRNAMVSVRRFPEMESSLNASIDMLRKFILYGKTNGIEVPHDIISWKPW